MSAIELEDIRIPGNLRAPVHIQLLIFCLDYTADSIADTSIWTGPRTLDNLVDFIVKGSLPSTRLLRPDPTTGF
jgi:hypothetical protein